MKTQLLILGLLCISAFSTSSEDAADTLASRFIFKADTDRRVAVDTMFKTNPTQVFQLCYGLKRQKLYDLIRAYFHPNIVNLVLYGSYSFFIQYNKDVQFINNNIEPVTAVAGPNAATGYYLSSHRYYDQDKRSEESTYVNIHSFGWAAKRWLLTPVASAFSGTAFYIQLYKDELQYDGIDQSNWYLSLQRLVAFDKLSGAMTNLIAIAGPTQSNVWVLTPVDRGGNFILTLAYDDYEFDGVSQTGWALDYVSTASQTRSSDVTDLDQSYYVVAQNKLIGANLPFRSWEIIFGGS